MTNKKKKQKEQETISYLKYLKQSKSIIKDFYPKIKSIKFEMNYTDPDFITAPHSKSYVIDSNHKASFFFDCPYTECIDGGYNLDVVVKKMYDENIKEQTGNLECQGWQDKSRINQHKCLCELNYKIIIEFKE